MITQRDKCLCCDEPLVNYDDTTLADKYCGNDICPFFCNDVTVGAIVNDYYIDKIKVLYAQVLTLSKRKVKVNNDG